jgi:hypothetical protein
MKYIVYKTTNLVNNYIYIGVHGTDTLETFDKYLGNGVYTNRPNTYEKAKTCFQQAVKQFGVTNFYRETLATFDTAEEAYALEELLVNDDFLARSDVYNMIRGGVINNTAGKTIYKYSAITGEFISSYPSVTAAAQSVKSSGSTLVHSIKHRFQIRGSVFDFNKVPKIDITMYNFKELQPVYRYKKDGSYDKAFDSLNQAGRYTFDTTATCIQKAARLGYLVKDAYYFSFYKCDKYDKARTEQIKKRPVSQYSSTGDFIKTYTTQEQAEKSNKCANITRAIKTRSKDCNGYYWSLEELPKFNCPVRRIAKKVVKVDELGNELQTWPSANACAKEVGTAVKKVLQGEYRRHKGFIYKYKND